MYVMFLLRPFTVHNVFPCFYGPNKVIIIYRGNKSTLVEEKSRLYVRAFSKMTINVWNKLSTDCVYASSVNAFKNGIDTYLVKA